MIEVNQITENNYRLITVIGEADASSSIELDKQIRVAMDSDEQNILTDCSRLS